MPTTRVVVLLLVPGGSAVDMVIYLLSVLVVAVSGIAVLPVFLRKAGILPWSWRAPPAGIKVDRQSAIVLGLPDHLQHLEPPFCRPRRCRSWIAPRSSED